MNDDPVRFLALIAGGGVIIVLGAGILALVPGKSIWKAVLSLFTATALLILGTSTWLLALDI